MLIPLRDTSRPYIFYAIVHLIPLKKHHRNTIVIMIPLQVEEFIVPLQSKPRCAWNPEGVARTQAGGEVRSTEPLLKRQQQIKTPTG